jgi:hypothetical protein
MSDEELYRLCLRVIRASQKMVEAQRTQIGLFISILPSLNVLTGRRKGTLEEMQALQESALQLEEAAFEMKCAWGDLLTIQGKETDFLEETKLDGKGDSTNPAIKNITNEIQAKEEKDES